jgi:excinuclease ABC subunit C
MMREVMTRRFERLLKEDPDRKSDAWPDLLLIDGGGGPNLSRGGDFG